MKTKFFIFDTNSLISALILPKSVSRLSLEKADEIGQLVFSEETLLELSEVLIRSKFDRYASIDNRLEFIERLEARSRVIATISNFTDCRDIKDNKFLNLAYDSGAAYIITGDHDLLILNPFYNIQIISPSTFLAASII
jgi:putative PIN family toxin of toxin-antitoxin system